MSTIDFESLDGTKLKGIWHVPAKPTSKVIILAHGITVTKDEDGIFITLAARLADEGYAVFRFDFRGHGESGGDSVDMTIAGELQDLQAAFDVVRNQGYTKIGLLGASFGGGIAALFKSENNNVLTCLGLWNPCLNYDHCFLHPETDWLRDQSSRLHSEIATQGWTTIGSRKFKVGKALFEEMEHVYPYEALKKITIPTIVVHGDHDTYVPFSDSVQYINNLPKSSELVIIEGSEHGFHDDGAGNQAIESTLQFFKKHQ